MAPNRHDQIVPEKAQEQREIGCQVKNQRVHKCIPVWQIGQSNIPRSQYSLLNGRLVNETEVFIQTYIPVSTVDTEPTPTTGQPDVLKNGQRTETRI